VAGRLRGDHHHRACIGLYKMQPGRPNCWSRRSNVNELRHQIQIRQPLTAAAKSLGGRHQARHRRDDRRQGRRPSAATGDCGQRAPRSRCAGPGRPASSSPRIDPHQTPLQAAMEGYPGRPRFEDTLGPSATSTSPAPAMSISSPFENTWRR